MSLPCRAVLRQYGLMSAVHYPIAPNAEAAMSAPLGRAARQSEAGLAVGADVAFATEAVGLTRRFLEEHGVTAEIEFSWGATEVKVPELVDAIVDLTETGSSLRANKLRIIDTIVESYPQLIVNKAIFADPEKRRKLEGMKLLLIGALNAREKVGLKMNVPKAMLDKLSAMLPSLRNPTISPLADTNWTAVEIIIDEAVVRDLIPRLKELGAEGIIEYPLNKVVY